MPIIPDYQPLEGSHRPATGSPETAGLVGRANAKLGEAVGNIADSVLDLHQRYQQIRDSGVRSTARLEMQQAETESAEYRRSNPDESLWEADRVQRHAKVREKVLGMKMTPLAKAELEQTFGTWDEEGKTRLEQEGMVQGVKRARQAATDAALAYRKAGNFSGAVQVTQDGVKSGVFSEAEGAADLADTAAEEAGAAKKNRLSVLEKQADDDPVAMLANLNAVKPDGTPLFEPDLEEGMRAKLRLRTELTLIREKNGEMESMKAGIDLGDVTEEEIMNLPQFLDHEDKLALLEHFRRVEMPDDEERQWAWDTLGEIGKGFAAVRNGGKGEADYRANYGKAWGEIHKRLPQGFKGEILNTLENFNPVRLGGNGMPAEGSSPKYEALLEMNRVIGNAYRGNLFGRTDKTPEERTAARAKWDEAHTAAGDWLAERGWKATKEEARKHAQSLLVVPRVQAGAAAVSDHVAGFGARLFQFDFASGREEIGADQPPATWEEVHSKIHGD